MVTLARPQRRRAGDSEASMNHRTGNRTAHATARAAGWHGGPSRAESEVTMLFGMPGSAIVPAEGKTNPQFVYDAYAAVTPRFGQNTNYAVYQMGTLLRKMMVKARTGMMPQD